MRIRVKPSSGDQVFVYIVVDRTEKVESARKKASQALEEEHGKPFPVNKLSLIYRGKQMANGMSLFDYGVSHGDTFISHIRLQHNEQEDSNEDVQTPNSADAPEDEDKDKAPISPASQSSGTATSEAAGQGAETVATCGNNVEIKCNYCDNSLTSECKHCGCNYCGKKDDEHHTLACDECGLFFHMRCLPVPLTVVPEGDWYCEFCKNDPSLVVSGEKKLDLAGTRRAKMPSAKQTRNWGGGMACAGTSKTCTIVPKDHAGSIPGVHVGQSWRYRIHVSESGIHRPPVGGIAGGSKTPAVSIVLAGGYPEDVDQGEEFIYTGSGGYDLSGNKRQAKVQTFDQELTRGNRSLALACAAPINEDTGATAKDWKLSSPIRVCRSYKVAKMHPQYAPKEGVRYDGLYRIVKYWKEKGVSGFYVWRYLFRRDDPEPAPWTEEGKEFISRMGLKMYDPEADADGRASKAKGSPPKTEKRKQETADAAELNFQPTPILKELMRLDTENSRLWANMAEKKYASESAYLEDMAEGHLSCPICQELVQSPVTLSCGHNACCSCLLRSITYYGNICPICRHDISDIGTKDEIKAKVNQNLVTVLRALIPTYGNDWITDPKVTTAQFARRQNSMN
ncbi:hypothetical protein H4R22_003101 [Coemansia sp. RSA 1290]|nr:hypothetical protein H4R22_003101 [Coemansia sp. RSA 1290]KAJ2650033.1 hypothetical protein IWW40_002746 [Coemansia sp. RSA 1250]